MSIFGTARAMLASLMTIVSGGRSDGLPSIRPLIGPMEAAGSFDFQAATPKKIAKLRKSASGIAFTRAGLAFIAFDEGLDGRFAELTETGYVPDPRPIPLRRDGVEVDAEGAASDGTHLYVVGSHSVKRQGGAENLTSRLLVRFDLGADGRVATDADGAVAEPNRGDLLAVIRGQPLLADAVDRPLDQGGLNIEGLAASGGRLLVGFRGPTDGERAFVLSVDADALFAGGDPGAHVDRITVGRGRAVRDLTAVDGGFLALAGPDDSPANNGAGWTIVEWDGRTSLPLAALDLGGVTPREKSDGCKDEDEVKPEAIAATETHPDRYRVLILSDGLCDGGPMWFDVPRPPH